MVPDTFITPGCTLPDAAPPVLIPEPVQEVGSLVIFVALQVIVGFVTPVSPKEGSTETSTTICGPVN
jgi:hypothetical protein